MKKITKPKFEIGEIVRYAGKSYRIKDPIFHNGFVHMYPLVGEYYLVKASVEEEAEYKKEETTVYEITCKGNCFEHEFFH